MKHKKPNLRTVKLHGKKTFLVTWPNPDGTRPNRKFFAEAKAEEAKTFLKAKVTEFENYGARSGTMPEALRSDAMRAAELLLPTGKTVLDAARHYFEYWQRQSQGVMLGDAVDAFLKEKKDMSKNYLSVMKPRLAAFSAACDKTTATITSQDIREFFAALEGYSATTISNWHRNLSAFFGYCLERGWCSENPVSSVRPPKVSQPEPEILTPAQAAALLAACDHDLLPAVAIAMFCGLRQAEIERLDWSAVNLVDGHITIGAKIAKTNSRRVVTMPDNLRAFLRDYRNKKGQVWPEGCRNRWNLARIAAGFGPFFSSAEPVQEAIAKAKKAKRKLIPWPNNALRHSCISYRVAQEKDLARIAYECGNSPQIVQKHYNGLANEKTAATFFAIRPAKATGKKMVEAKFAA
jgi:integrase